MTFDEFINKYKGKYVEVAGSANAKNQCVDLVNAYIRDVLKLPIIEWTNAVDFPSKAGDKYEWIKNTPKGIPEKGDIMIWNSGKYGHIGIFIEGDINRFRSFDQNYPLNTPAHIQGHTYANVSGWLRPKGGDSDMQEDLNECRNRRDELWNWRGEVNEALGLPHDASQETILKSIAGIQGEAKSNREKVAILEQEVKNRSEQIGRLKVDIAKLEVERDEARSNNMLLHNQIDDLSKTIGGLNNDLAKCQSGQEKCTLFTLLRRLWQR